jgi:Holliday junction resolvase RusA-like endonuclease
VSKYGTYYPKTYATFRKEFGRMVEAAGLPTPGVAPVNVYLEFVRSKPTKPANSFPMGDIDNYIKSVLDSIQGHGIFEDDKFVQVVTASKRYVAKGEKPHITIVWNDPGSKDDPHSEDVLDQSDTISIEEIEE